MSVSPITWEQRKLGDFGAVAMCKRIYKEQTSVSGDVPFYKIGTFGGTADAFISDELFELYRARYPYPQPGALLISAAGSIGRIVEYRGERAYYQDSNIVWLEHNECLDDSFLKQLYSQIHWGLEGSTIQRLYNKDILGASVTVPSFEEQRLVGSLFARIDSLITLHQREGCKRFKGKPGLLQKLRSHKKSPTYRAFPSVSRSITPQSLFDFTAMLQSCIAQQLNTKKFQLVSDNLF